MSVFLNFWQFVVSVWDPPQISLYWFSILWLYWIHISSKSFLLASLRFPVNSICKYGMVYLFFSTGIPFFFLFLASPLVAKTSNIVLNESNEGHPCLIPSLKGKAWFFFTEYDVSCGFATHGLYCMLKYFPLSPLCCEFLCGYWIVYAFCIYWDDSMIFSSYIVNLWYTTCWFCGC